MADDFGDSAADSDYGNSDLDSDSDQGSFTQSIAGLASNGAGVPSAGELQAAGSLLSSLSPQPQPISSGAASTGATGPFNFGNISSNTGSGSANATGSAGSAAASLSITDWVLIGSSVIGLIVTLFIVLRK